MPYVYLPSQARFRDTDTGRYVKTKTVLSYTRSSAQAAGDYVAEHAQAAHAGDMTRADFRDLMRQEIKDEAIRQYVTGRGGLEQMTQRDWGTIGAHTKAQYKYLEGFIDALKADELSEGMATSRARLYMNAARTMFEVGRAEAVDKAGGFSEEHWDLGDTRETCVDCLKYAGMGWQPIGTFPTPGDGSTVCKANCGCSKSYR